MTNETISIREWLPYGGLEYGIARGGLSHLNGSGGLGSLNWYFATY